jgi:hypothetical protein
MTVTTKTAAALIKLSLKADSISDILKQAGPDWREAANAVENASYLLAGAALQIEERAAAYIEAVRED